MKGDVFLATLPLKHHGNHMFWPRFLSTAICFFCAQQHCLLLAQMEAQRQHFGLARRGRWLRLRVTKHLVPSGDQPWLAGKNGGFNGKSSNQRGDFPARHHFFAAGLKDLRGNLGR